MIKDRKQEAIDKANKIHNFKYDYSLIKEYLNNKAYYPVICHEKDSEGNEHGAFLTTFSRHINRYQGCPKCKSEHLRQLFSLTKEEFVQRCKILFGNKYTFDKTEYVNMNSEVIITCPIHGDFEMILENLLKGHGCPKCSQSLGEALVESKLVENGISFQTQVSFPFLKHKQGRKSLDFYLPEYNIAIEYQGSQHFVPIENFGGQEHLNQQNERDKIKYQLCKNNNIYIFYIVKKEDYNKIQELDIYNKDNTFTSIDECINVIKRRLISK